MTTTVWKFDLVQGRNRINMPLGAVVLDAGTQQVRHPKQGFIELTFRLWALVIPERATEKRQFVVVATGEVIPGNMDELKFVGRMAVDNDRCEGALQFHVFEIVS